MAKRAIFVAITGRVNGATSVGFQSGFGGAPSDTQLGRDNTRNAIMAAITQMSYFYDNSFNTMDIGFAITAHDQDAVARNYLDFHSVSLGSVNSFLQPEDDGAGEVFDWVYCATAAHAFFNGTLADDYEKRTLLFISNSASGPDDDNAKAILVDELDRNSGLFSITNDSVVDVHHLILGGSSLRHIDNTPDDKSAGVLGDSYRQSILEAETLRKYVGGVLLPIDTNKVWPFDINWKNGFTEEIAFRTEIITATDGTEQRIQQRIKPRYKVTYSSVVSQGQLQSALHAAQNRQGGVFVVPDTFDPMITSTDEAALSYGLESDPGEPDWVESGQAVYIKTPTDAAMANYIVTHDSGGVGTPTIALSHAIPFPTPIGTEVFPAAFARFSRSIDVPLRTNTVASIKTEFDLDEVTTRVRDYGVATNVIDGLEYFDVVPNWSQPVTLSFTQDRELVDVGKGSVGIVLNSETTMRTYKAKYSQLGTAEADKLLGLFHRTKGRLKAFLMPLWADELEPVSGVSSASDSMTMLGRTVFDSFKGSSTYTRVRVHTATGAIVLPVDSVTLDGAGNSVITFTAASVATDILSEDIFSVCWVIPVRFSADMLTVTWHTKEVLEATVNVTPLEEAI